MSTVQHLIESKLADGLPVAVRLASPIGMLYGNLDALVAEDEQCVKLVITNVLLEPATREILISKQHLENSALREEHGVWVLKARST